MLLAASFPAGKPVTADLREEGEISLKELDDSARVFKAAALESDVLLPVRHAWPSVARGPTGASLDRFQNALLHATNLISDASTLTFESHVIEADLQDAQFANVPLVVQHLAVAGTIAELDAGGRPIPVDDRIKIAQLVADGTVSIGAIHTYVELYARMVIDLRPDVALLCASAADEQGNLIIRARS